MNTGRPWFVERRRVLDQGEGYSSISHQFQPRMLQIATKAKKVASGVGPCLKDRVRMADGGPFAVDPMQRQQRGGSNKDQATGGAEYRR